MFAIGCAMQGKIYNPNTGDLLDILGFAGQLGTGMLYLLARLARLGSGRASYSRPQDYGTKFIVVAGLLNIVAAS